MSVNGANRRASEAERGAQSVRRAAIEVRWRVSASRLPSTIRPKGAARRVELVMRLEGVEGGAWRAWAWCEGKDGSRGATAAEFGGSGARALRIDEEAAGDVVLVEAPEALSATLERRGDGSWRLLYVWTSLLSRLEVQGGCYEVAGGRLETFGAGEGEAHPGGASRRSGTLPARRRAHGSARGGSRD